MVWHATLAYHPALSVVSFGFVFARANALERDVPQGQEALPITQTNARQETTNRLAVEKLALMSEDDRPGRLPSGGLHF